MNGDTRHILNLLLRSGVHKLSIETEHYIRDLDYSVDLLIKSDDSNISCDKENKIKGIVIEFDGPHHYYSPIVNNFARYNSISLSKQKLIRAYGYKLFIFPFFWAF
jgi:hypothetical protein